MTRRVLIVAFVLFAVVGCRPASQTQSAVVIPTLASLPDGTPLALADAEVVARNFLESWREFDYDTMYSLIAFSGQDATPHDEFVDLYQSSADTMTLQSLDYHGNTLGRNGDVAVFNYDVTFQTRIVGDFTETNRDLQLIYDQRANDWRVAWSPGDFFPEMAQGGRLRLRPIIPPRANIYDRTGNVTLADQTGRVVVINVIREQIPDYPACLSALSTALNKPAADIQATLEERPANWLMDMGTVEAAVWESSHAQLEAVCAAQFEGLSVRHYNNGPVASNIVGYVGYPDEADISTIEAAGFEQDSILGRSGVEKSWDETLRGHPGGELSIVTPGGDVLREITTRRSDPPQSVWLTIDADLQAGVEQILADAYTQAADTWAKTSPGASVVMMNIHTGEILAMVTYPTFDNNAFTPFPVMGQDAAAAMVAQVQADPRHPQLNRPTLGAYPLGSVMKLVSSTAVADSGVYALDERFTCTGIWSRDIVRHDWLAGGHGTITLPQAITRSCNPFFYEVGYRLASVDPYILPGYARQYGFGSATGIGDIAEADGLIVDPDWWRTNIGSEWNFSEEVNMAIGQGYLQVTPLQVVRMVATIANNGTLYRPQLVKQVGLLGEAPSYVAAPEVVHELTVRPEVFDMVRGGMCDVTTTPLGTAEFVFRDSQLQTIGICGKTGTAQAPPSPITHAWFASYSPREDPQIALIVMVENGGEGSGVAAPLARKIWEYYYFGRSQGSITNS
jgi:penicillin-binding protein 2